MRGDKRGIFKGRSLLGNSADNAPSVQTCWSQVRTLLCTQWVGGHVLCVTAAQSGCVRHVSRGGEGGVDVGGKAIFLTCSIFLQVSLVLLAVIIHLERGEEEK